MNKEQRQFKKSMKARKIRKFYVKFRNMMKNNISKEFRYGLKPDQGLPKSRKYKTKK